MKGEREREIKSHFRKSRCTVMPIHLPLHSKILTKTIQFSAETEDSRVKHQSGFTRFNSQVSRHQKGQDEREGEHLCQEIYPRANPLDRNRTDGRYQCSLDEYWEFNVCVCVCVCVKLTCA